MTLAPLQCEPAFADSNAPEERRDFARVRAARRDKREKPE